MRKLWITGAVLWALSAQLACNAGQVISAISQNGTATPGSPTGTTSAAQQPTGPAATPPAEASTHCKRGVAYNAMTPNDWLALSPNIAWFYSWSAQAQPQAIAQDANAIKHYVPMAWGQSQLSGITAGMLPASGFLLGFNEPNFGSQANLTASAAAALWPQVEAIARAQNMNIISPSVNYCGGSCTSTSPFDWLDQFFAACTGCRVDAIAVHVYMCNPNDVQNYLKQFETRYNKPLWVTEFSCLDTTGPTAAQELAYMNAVIPMLEADPMVHRYAWFTGRDPAQSAVDLLSTNGALTPLGQAYVSLPQACMTTP